MHLCWTVSCSFGLIAYTQTVSLMGILKSIFKVGFAMNDLELATEFNDNSVLYLGCESDVHLLIGFKKKS